MVKFDLNDYFLLVLSIMVVMELTWALSFPQLSDAELNEVLPSAAYALAKSRLHLIVSGYV